MFEHLHKTGRELLSPETWKARLVFWSGAVLVGLLATGFAISTEWANRWFVHLTAHNPYAPLVLCPLGLAGVAWLTRRLFPGAQGSGIPQSIAALNMTEHVSRKLLLSFRIAIGKILLTLLGLMSGASIGREGPTVHIGAAVMFSLGRFAHFPQHYMDRGLILAGGAAGIGAAFNTPLAGILFAIEEMGRSFEERTSGTMLTAVFLAGITAVGIQGNYTYFGVSTATLEPRQILIPVVVCGVLGGLLGGLFSTVLIWGSRRLAPHMHRNAVFIALCCGLVIAVVGMLSGGLTFGTGYHEARLVVEGNGPLPGSYTLLKMLATVASYLSGIPGGIFAPSLATGAGLGSILGDWMPFVPAGAIVILGMVGYFTGVVQTPITASVIVMEMTDNAQLILPLLATAFLAYATSHLVCPQPIYRALAEDFMPRRPRPAAGSASRQQFETGD